ncbi:Predicted membrane protein [Halogeometricum rufum]|uniref:Predicted membrane protein n=1 Tax=Halogeometricum rufum TaxID=553469 RepID=A0A1I6J987_9EURY|nr:MULTISPECIES: DUF2178 domain-containing protein [Halogeometricum]MUV58041.1 DUF2178 domain-containing protein [Halogeometricum sp. CBA1124]SFR75491.1 Predicted membrane protein [Halogeometricum rufum]
MSTSTTTIGSETTYRRLYTGLWALSGVALAGGIVVGYPLVGVGGFAALALAALLTFRRYDGPLFDERDERRQAAASKRTLAVMGVTSSLVFPAVTALWALGVVEWPLWLTPIAFFVAALTFVHVGSTMYESARAA